MHVYTNKNKYTQIYVIKWKIPSQQKNQKHIGHGSISQHFLQFLKLPNQIAPRHRDSLPWSQAKSLPVALVFGEMDAGVEAPFTKNTAPKVRMTVENQPMWLKMYLL